MGVEGLVQNHFWGLGFKLNPRLGFRVLGFGILRFRGVWFLRKI